MNESNNLPDSIIGKVNKIRKKYFVNDVKLNFE